MAQFDSMVQFGFLVFLFYQIAILGWGRGLTMISSPNLQSLTVEELSWCRYFLQLRIGST